MSPVRVKICGISDPIGFDAAADAGADWVGFVFCRASPRFVTAAAAAELSARRDGGPRRVGLFVSPTEAELAAVLDTVRLDAVQLYGSRLEPRAVRARFGIDVWRAVGVAGVDDLPGTATDADALVIEAKAASGAGRPGGNAQTFDWGLLTGWTSPAPWLLAGGLTPENVAVAVAATGARAVDVSSGVERAPGVKDAGLIRRFADACRRVG